MNENAVDLKASVLCGLHHGDRRVSDIEFVHGVTPNIAVVMCKLHNPEGYPHREALESFKSSLTPLLRTDINGEVVILWVKFVKDHLGYQPDEKRALEYLRKTHAKYLPPELAAATAAAD